MSTHALRTGAARAAGPCSGQRGRQPSNSALEALIRYSSQLDALIRDVELGARSHRDHDRFVDETETIGAGIAGVYRKPTRQPSHPPLAQKGGKAWW